MARIKMILFALVLSSSILISGCSKYKFYSVAINAERGKADLVVKKTTISIGDIVYLDNLSEEALKENRDVIIMVHGFGGDKDNWLRLSKEMADDYRILVPDLPGHGDSVSDLSNNYTVANQAKWLNEFMAKLNISKAHIVGNSMGGAISLKVTHLYPEKIASLTLLNSAGFKKNESEFVGLLKKGVNPLVIGSTEEFKELMSFVMEKEPYIPGPVYSVLAEKKIARQKLDDKIFQDIMTDINKVETFLSEIKSPTLIIWGESDRIIHVDNAEMFKQKIAGSQKIIFEEVGHLPMIEAPEKTGENYSRFLLSCRKNL